ncbi:MAG TPA: hypothetical protein VFP84_14195 [Kofleriaceae bacterium]|nr:hypothetical protein [Kofleriaceae bacterium]
MKIAAFGLGAALIAGCTAAEADVQPPKDQLFFPTGLAVDPLETVLFSANSNSELRYDSGTLLVFDLKQIEQIITAWTTSRSTGPCSIDPDHPESLICDEVPDPQNHISLVNPDAGVRTGNFATEISVQKFGNDPGDDHVRLFMPTRGDPSVNWADFDGTSLHCAPGNEKFALCDDAHRLTQTIEDLDNTNLADEPFGVFADGDADGTGFAVVSHQTNGAVTLIDSPRDGTVQIADTKYNVFLPDVLTAIRGSTGVAGRRDLTDPNSLAANDTVYVSSRTDSKVQMFTVGRPVNHAPPYFVTGNFIELDQVGIGAGVGASVDSRGVKFSPDGNRMYLLTRTPPAIQLYDTAIGPSGFPRNELTGASDICRNSSTLTIVNFDASQPGSVPGSTPGVPSTVNERGYLTCFDDNVIYVIDPTGSTSVEDIIPVGRGPFAIVAAPKAQLLFVSNFVEDTISVIDVNPTSPNRNRVVLRIGTPKAPTV